MKLSASRSKEPEKKVTKRVSFDVESTKESIVSKENGKERKGLQWRQNEFTGDASAFERLAYLEALDVNTPTECADQKTKEDEGKNRIEEADGEEQEGGKITKESIKRLLAVYVNTGKMKYKLCMDKKRKTFNHFQTDILKEEVISKTPDVLRIVKCLEKGADPNVKLDQSHTKPLHAVIRRGDPRLVDYLLQAGADVNCVDGRNQTPLAKACDSQRVDRSYIRMVEVLLTHPDAYKGLEYRDAGGNTALLNAVFRSNVWLTRLLLLHGAKVMTGKRNAYDVALFIMAEHIHLDVEEFPDFLLHPPSKFYKKFSFKGRYYSWNEVFWQSLTNSDIELVFRMVQYRYEEIEREKAAGKKKGEEPEVPKMVVEEAIGRSAEAKLRKTERELRRINERRERKEKEEKDRWERKKQAMREKVDDEFSIKVYRNVTQKWQSSSNAPSKQETPSSPASSKGGFMGDEEMNDYTFQLKKYDQEHPRSLKRSSSSSSVYGHSGRSESAVKVNHRIAAQGKRETVGRRWRVTGEEVEEKLYSRNPAPGIPLVSFVDKTPRVSRSAGTAGEER